MSRDTRELCPELRHLRPLQRRIQLVADELDRWAWVQVDQLPEYVIPRLARRLISAHHAHAAGTQLYLEHGQPVMTPADSQLVPPSP